MRINEIIYSNEGYIPMENQKLYDDWTGNVIRDASLRSLDPEAVRAARAIFSSSFRDRADECAQWDDETFLTRTGVLKRGRITVSAMILLGKVSEPFIPSDIRIRWRLYDTSGRLEDERIFDEPMILAVSHAASVIRNSSVRIEGQNPRYVSAYRIKTLEEALYNAVAHQDYGESSMIDLIERDRESVSVISKGSFPDYPPESFVLSAAPSIKRRNPFLCKAMAGIGLAPMSMSGIKGMYLSQAYRHYPMPRYSITDGSVTVTFPGTRYGNYVRIMDARDDLDIETIMDLDRISRGLYVQDRRMAILERRGLLRVSDGIPHLIFDDDMPHIRLFKGTDSEAVLDFIREHGCVRRSDVVEIISARSSKDLTSEQLSVKATNLLQTMRKNGAIRKSDGNTRSATYVLN